MEKLPKEFKKWEFKFTQIDRKNMCAIYEQSLANTGKVVSYEVIIIQHQKEHERFGQKFTEKEFYPSSGTWGTYGWTFPNLESARGKFDELCERSK